MKIGFFFVLLMTLISCSNSKSVYWCGDHACINKKEKEDYFKKTMIVEKRIINKKNKKNLTKSEKIIGKSKKNEKEIISNELEIKKINKLEKKRLKKEQEELVKKNKLEKIRLKKEQKELVKKNKLEKIKLKKEQKELARRAKKTEKKGKDKLIKEDETIVIKDQKTTSFSSSLQDTEFEQIKDRIIQKNLIRPYPNINDIPN